MSIDGGVGGGYGSDRARRWGAGGSGGGGVGAGQAAEGGGGDGEGGTVGDGCGVGACVERGVGEPPKRVHDRARVPPNSSFQLPPLGRRVEGEHVGADRARHRRRQEGGDRWPPSRLPRRPRRRPGRHPQRVSDFSFFLRFFLFVYII